MPQVCPINLSIVRAADRTIFESALNVFKAASLPVHNVKVRLLVCWRSQHGGRDDVLVEIGDFGNKGEKVKEKLDPYFDLNGHYFNKLEVTSSDQMLLVINRNFNLDDLSKNQPYDVLTLTPHGTEHNELKVARMVKAVRDNFKIADHGLLLDQVGEDLKRYYGVRESNLQKLEDKLGEFTSKLADFSIQNEKELLEKKNTLEEAHRSRMNELEEERKKLQEEYEERRKALDERAAKINDRENVHERRRLYDEIKKQIQAKSTKPELTAHTQKLRNMVWWLSGGLGTFLLGIFVICFTINLRGETPNWVAIGSQIVSGATLIGLVTFVMRWQNHWFQTHADDEYRLKRMELDIERASWLVELALEWFNETEAPIPEELMNKLATHLFVVDGEMPLDMSPLESLRTGMLGKNWKILLEPTKVEAQSGKQGGAK